MKAVILAGRFGSQLIPPRDLLDELAQQLG